MADLVLVPFNWVYDHLICEFDHYDICLTGLVDRDGERWFCKVCDPDEEHVEYVLRRVAWNEECDEFLSDYRKAYRHWFHGEEWCSYTGWDLSWFEKKWQHRNPIAEATE